MPTCNNYLQTFRHHYLQLALSVTSVMMRLYFNTRNKISDIKPIPYHKVSLWKETGPKLFDYMWMAHLHNDVTLPVKHRGKACKLVAHGENMFLNVFKSSQRSFTQQHLLVKADRSASMNSSGIEPLSLSVFLFHTNPRVRPAAAPSSSILSTRNWPNAQAENTTHFLPLHYFYDLHVKLQKRVTNDCCQRVKVGGSHLDVRILQFQSFESRWWLPCPELGQQVSQKRSPPAI